MGGEVRFRSGEIVRLKARELPGAAEEFVSTLRPRAEGEFYRVNLFPETYLAIQNGLGTPARQDRFCSVISRAIPYMQALETIDPSRIEVSASERRKRDRMGWHRSTSSLGYQLIIQRLRDGSIAMTSILPSQERLKSREYTCVAKGPAC
jgi:hypothetical protein